VRNQEEFMVPQRTKFQRGSALLALLLAGCAAEWEERSGEDDGLRQPGPIAETHAIVDGSRDPLVVREGALLRIRCLAFDDEGLVASSQGLVATLRSGIGLARVRPEGWLEIYQAGRVEVACDAPNATVRSTLLMVEPRVEQTPAAALAPPR
jgi:hypothetical protein